MQTIKGKAKCNRILFEKNGFVIALFSPIDKDTEMPSSFSMKGNIFVKQGETYKIHGELDTKTKYDDSYDSIHVARDIDLKREDKESVRAFLETAISEAKAELIVNNLDDPIEVLENKDVIKLSTIKGIGNATAEKLINTYFAQKDYSHAYIELSKYRLTTKAIKKICTFYGDPDKAVATIEENPYNLTEVEGYGFTKADAIFLSSPDAKPTDKRRVRAYIKYMFEKESDGGNSWMTPNDFISGLKEFIPNADLRYAVDYIQTSEKYVYMSDGEDKRIATKEMYNTEKEIAKELARLMSRPTTMDLSGYEKSVEATERMNGWEYSQEQREAIDNMVELNVYMLQGLSGTGKSSLVKAFLNAVEASGYTYSQAALAGKAADNLTKVTGKQGYTIHSLLGFNPEKNGFEYDKDNPLPAHVVVLDEISMVNAQIFLSLLKAIRTGSKLIMIGDYGQLESIGVGVMGGMIMSKRIPMTLLKKIHRQAQDSAIITHSISVRNGQKPQELDLKADRNDIYGNREDLEYVIVDTKDEDSILKHTIAKFKTALDSYDINDIQIICSTKKTGKVSTFELNRLAQMVYNSNKDGESIELGYKDYRYILRVGDKVINMKNNRNTLSPAGIVTPIYNGNTGIVKEIGVNEDGDYLVINFDGIGEVFVDGEAVKNIELGYAITTHKSQGSTIKHVIFALPFHYLLNSKELVYTGMTRASEYQVIITSPRSFRKAIQTTSVSRKKVNLPKLIQEVFDKREIKTV